MQKAVKTLIRRHAYKWKNEHKECGQSRRCGPIANIENIPHDVVRVNEWCVKGFLRFSAERSGANILIQADGERKRTAYNEAWSNGAKRTGWECEWGGSAPILLATNEASVNELNVAERMEWVEHRSNKGRRTTTNTISASVNERLYCVLQGSNLVLLASNALERSKAKRSPALYLNIFIRDIPTRQ